MGSDGRVLLFDSSLFTAGAGGVISPAAAQKIAASGAAIVGLEWLSGEASFEPLKTLVEQGLWLAGLLLRTVLILQILLQLQSRPFGSKSYKC